MGSVSVSVHTILRAAVGYQRTASPAALIRSSTFITIQPRDSTLQRFNVFLILLLTTLELRVSGESTSLPETGAFLPKPFNTGSPRACVSTLLDATH